MRRCTSRARPDSKRTTRYLPRRSTASTRSPDQLGGHLERVLRARQARIEDLDAVEAPADEHGLEPAANGLDFGQLGHAASVVRCV